MLIRNCFGFSGLASPTASIGPVPQPAIVVASSASRSPRIATTPLTHSLPSADLRWHRLNMRCPLRGGNCFEEASVVTQEAPPQKSVYVVGLQSLGFPVRSQIYRALFRI